MTDWDAFIESVPWFTNADTSRVTVFDTKAGYSLSRIATSTFPTLSKLLAKSEHTPVVIENIEYDLLAWDSNDGYRVGWLCLPPPSEIPDSLFPCHADLLSAFGGIVERFNEPSETWLLNHNEALTLREASHDASFILDYSWAFTDVGLELPINPGEFYSIAREANGNTTLCHRSSGRVMLFATDHCFEHITPCENCPEYTLYDIDGAHTFQEWVEIVSAQWDHFTLKGD